jgi:hypothetical protein
MYIAVATACAVADKVHLQWVVAIEGSKILPHGVVLTNKKEIIVKLVGGTVL